MTAHGRPAGNLFAWSSTSISTSLLDRVKSRDQDAWRRLVDLFGPLVYQWCRRWGIPRSDAPDVVQEVFRAVASGIGRFHRDRRRGTFRGWLWTVARNEARDHFTRRGNHPLAIGGSELLARLQEIPEQYPEEASHPEADEEHRCLMHRAVAVIRGDFQERTWQAFWRTAIEGQPAAEAARDLAMTGRAVRQAKHRVLQRLREEFGDLID